MYVHSIAYRLSDIAFLFVGPIVVQLVLYSVVVRHLWRHNSATRGSVLATRRNRQLAKRCIAVLSVFGVCCGPYFVADIIIDRVVDSAGLEFDDQLRAESASITARKTFVMFAFAYGWITPLVYMMFNKKVHARVAQLLARCCFSAGDRDCRGNRVQPVMLVAHVPDENIYKVIGGQRIERIFPLRIERLEKIFEGESKTCRSFEAN